jgi:DNA repair protein RecN (Recombination protein N)
LLNHLHIRNLAVVDEVEVEIAAGMTVLTGETGAGKSILIDALSLALGARADSDAVRPDASRAEVSASFALDPGCPALDWLAANELDDGRDCILRRTVTAEGRSRGYINGNSVAVATLRELGDLLVDICGQQAHQSLIRPENQRRLLDAHGGHQRLLDDIAITHASWQTAQAAFDKLDAARADQAARLELLAFQVRELESLAPQVGELEAIEHQHRRSANSARLLSEAGDALDNLYQSEQANAHDLLSKAQILLAKSAALEPQFENVAKLLAEATISVTEAAHALRDYIEQIDTDPAQLESLETRLAAFQDIARKHRVEPDELPDLLITLQNDLHQIEHADETLEELAAKAKAEQASLKKLCNKLTKAREQAARELSAQVTAYIRELGMPAGSFEVRLLAQEAPGPGGSERIEFAVAINPGLPAGPLNKVASGGELSRVSLAIQVASSSQGDAQTLIFDEVDAGVGGETADIVGDKLRDLTAKNQQVLCVTHLPQVACKGHNHFRISKLTDGDKTRTRIAPLDNAERIEEIARMLGGKKITDRTREHAAEMLGINAADKPRKSAG